MSDARDAGNNLGLILANSLSPPPTPTIRYGTLLCAYMSGGSILADVQVAGGTLTGIPMTQAAARARSGDRVIITTYAHLSTVTGLIATSVTSRSIFEWSSTWSGTPSDVEYTEKEQNVEIYTGLVLCEFRASLKGSGEYGCMLTFTDTAPPTPWQLNGRQPLHPWAMTKPPSAGT